MMAETEIEQNGGEKVLRCGAATFVGLTSVLMDESTSMDWFIDPSLSCQIVRSTSVSIFENISP